MSDRYAAEIEVCGLSKEFGSGLSRKLALSSIDLRLRLDEAVGVVGESGSGKSTLGRILVGLETPTRGAVLLDGVPLSTVLRSRASRDRYRRSIQYVAQDTSGSFEPGRRCIDSLSFPARHLLDEPRRETERRIHELAEAFSLATPLLHRYPNELSGGQRQRLALIRGLVSLPRLLVCDEVVSALDVTVQARVLNTLRALAEERGLGLIFISHGLPATAFVAERLVVMQTGEIVESGTTEQVVERPAHPYTRELLDAFRTISGESLESAA